MSPDERRSMINRECADLILAKQYKLLHLSRSSLYYTPFWRECGDTETDK